MPSLDPTIAISQQPHREGTPLNSVGQSDYLNADVTLLLEVWLLKYSTVVASILGEGCFDIECLFTKDKH